MKSIHKFEIEISSFCNRKCEWCSNNLIDRSFNKIMKEEIFIKIISELEHLNYNKEEVVITFSKFNEPTFDIELLKIRSLQLKLFLPNIRLSINTNGDYLNDEIFSLPIDILGIMDYDDKGIEYGYELLKRYGAKKIENVNTKLSTDINGISVRFFYNWQKNFLIEDRGNLLHDINLNWRQYEELRTKPCLINNRPLSIDYLGNVTPCCHIRGDADLHKEYIMGNVNNDTIFNIINNDKFNKFNDTMERRDNTKYFKPCQYCQKSIC